MMRKIHRITWLGRTIVITDRVKPGIYLSGQYMLVHHTKEDSLLDWIESRAYIV